MFFFRSKNIKNLSDNELVARFREAGENRYLETLLDRYYHLVFGVCLKYLKDQDKSNEASGAIFEKLVNEIHKTEINNLSSWLGTVTRNYCLTQIRNENRRNENTTVVDFTVIREEDEYTDDEEVDKETLLQKMEKALESLKPAQKTCVELFYLQDKSYKEITDMTGFDIKEVKSHIQNGRRSLKILVTNQDDAVRRQIS